MSEENADGQGGYGLARLAPILMAAAMGVVLLVSVVSMFLVISLMGDVATLQEQGRRSAKANRVLQEEVVALREIMQRPKPEPIPVAAEAKPTNIDAADTRNDCVIRSGEKGGVADCIRTEPKGAPGK